MASDLKKRLHPPMSLPGSITKRWRVGVTIIGALLVLVGGFMLSDKPFVLNLSPSIPFGFYARSHDEPAVGKLIECRYPLLLATKNHFFTPFILKPILAGPGDHVDTTGDWLVVNGCRIAPIHTTDSSGGPLPVWRANQILKPDEFFVFSARVFNSFDSRYFGPIRRSDIVTVRAPLWTWGKQDLPASVARSSAAESRKIE